MTTFSSPVLSSPAAKLGKNAIAALLLVLLAQLLVRFAVQPAVGFVLDDWSYREEALHYDSFSDALVAGVRHPHRPFLHAIQLGVNWALGDNLSSFLLLSMFGYSLALLFLFLLLRELTDHPAAAIVGTLAFSLLPNQCDQFHWLCIAVPYGLFCQPLCLLSAWCLVRYGRRGNAVFLAASSAAYFFACGIYEVGVFLPMAYAVLLWGRPWKRWLASLLPFAAAFALYASWRLTNGFGWGHSWFGIPPQTGISFNLYGLKMTAATIVSWWGGQNWWRAIGFGSVGFGELPWPRAAVLFAADFALLASLALVLRRLAHRNPHDSSAPFSTRRLLLFGTTWFAAALIPAFLGYFVTRINYLPGVGATILLTVAFARISPSRWLPALLPLALAGMLVAQGDALNWASSIRFQENLFDTMQKCRPDWEDAEILWLDTRALSQRLTPGMLSPERHHIDTIAEWRNAGLLRGFAPSAMAKLVLKDAPGPQVILDVEYGAHQERDILFWHERYNPDAPRQTQIEHVFKIDVFEAGTVKAP